ncbi:hypothetical protein K1T71_002770 [Dendrolimus kikuchii]|uniref:Uncharacterized protein n=1 Tax=Dendrolimus kikuchii TaxID=765133 RepID=A0ACC1DDL4_9NEOP|nr:hypothetical protein K1T71_002770 [Dendrolimus kikuchii]
MAMKFDDDGVPYVMWGSNKIQLETNPVTEKKILDKAENELRETPEVVEKALAELRELIKGENSLYVPAESDDFLLKFLRPTKFYAESAFQKLKAYYKFRTTYSEYCDNLSPSFNRAAFRHSVVSILSPRDQHGRRIMLVESGERWNHRVVSLKDVFRAAQVALEGAMREPKTQICGVIALMDMKGLCLSQILQFTPNYAKMALEWTQECVPARIKAVHVINQPYIFNMLFAIFKPFIAEKLRTRLHLHGSNIQSLLTHIDPKALRKRHGGLLPEPEIPGDVLWEMLRHYEEEYKLISSYGYNMNNNK